MLNENFITPEMLALYEDSLKEEGISKRGKIISVISNFNFDNFRSDTECINLYIDDSGYPVFNMKRNSVEVRLIHTFCEGWLLEDTNFTLEVFVYGKTIVSSNKKMPKLCIEVSQTIAKIYLESVRPVYKNQVNLFRKFQKRNNFSKELVTV